MDSSRTEGKRGAELQTQAGGRGRAGARAHAGVWAASMANAFLVSRHRGRRGARRSEAVQLEADEEDKGSLAARLSGCSPTTRPKK